MINLNNLNEWAGKGNYVSRTSAHSYLSAAGSEITASGCGSSCGSKDGDSNSKPVACGVGDSDPKPSACGAGDTDSKPKTSACGSGCGAGGK